MGSPLSCSLFTYMEVVGSLIWMAEFPWAAHSAAHWAAHCFHIWKSWAALFAWQNSMGSPRATNSFAHGQRSGELPCFFRMGSQHTLLDFFAPVILSFIGLNLNSRIAWKRKKREIALYHQRWMTETNMYLVYPSILQTTLAASSSKTSSQTEPHVPLYRTSSLPSYWFAPPTSRVVTLK